MDLAYSHTLHPCKQNEKDGDDNTDVLWLYGTILSLLLSKGSYHNSNFLENKKKKKKKKHLT